MKELDFENVPDKYLNMALIKDESNEKQYKRICAKIPNLVTISSLALAYFTETPAYLLLAVVGEAGRMVGRSYFDQVVAQDYEELAEIQVDKEEAEKLAKSIKPEEDQWKDRDGRKEDDEMEDMA